MTSFIEIGVKPRKFYGYKNLTPKIYKLAKTAAKKLKGKKILHINSTAYGGGVAELLKSQVSLENGLGIKSRWLVMNPPARFFKITKKIHNLLQGKRGSSLSRNEKSTYLAVVKKILPDFDKLADAFKPDIVIIHDPQPLPLIESAAASQTTFLLRMHIDLSAPNPDAMKFLRPLIQKFSLVIFTSKTYRPRWLKREKARFIMPAIDPFSAKNKKMPASKAKNILALYGVNPNKPLISQISRFDPWKDPIGVVNAYYSAKKEISGLQLILAGITEAADDPEAKEFFKKVKKRAAGNPGIFLFSKKEDLLGVPNAVAINAAQTASNAVLQKSIREGFGLTVTEAMWKGKAVIGGRAKGIMLQIKNNRNGFLASSSQEASRRIVNLIQNPKLAARIGKKARQTVRQKFLMSRLILDHLRLYRILLS